MSADLRLASTSSPRSRSPHRLTANQSLLRFSSVNHRQALLSPLPSVLPCGHRVFCSTSWSVVSRCQRELDTHFGQRQVRPEDGSTQLPIWLIIGRPVTKVNKQKIVDIIVSENRLRFADQYREWHREGKQTVFKACLILGMRLDNARSSIMPSPVSGASSRSLPITDEDAEEILTVDVSTRNKWLKIISDQRFEMQVTTEVLGPHSVP